MDRKKLGRQTVRFASPPSIAGFGNAVGQKERDGPLGPYFDLAGEDAGLMAQGERCAGGDPSDHYHGGNDNGERTPLG